MEVVVTTGAVRRAKLRSNRHHQQADTQLFTGRMPFLSPNQQRQSIEGNIEIPKYLHCKTYIPADKSILQCCDTVGWVT